MTQRTLDSTRRLAEAGRLVVAVLVLGLALAGPAAADDPPTPETPVPGAPVTSEPDSTADGAEAVPTDDLAPLPAPAAPGAAVPNPRLTGVPMVRLSRRPHNVLRTGPGDEFAIAAVRDKGEEFEVVAKHGDWYGVRISPTETAWVHASLCHEYEDMSKLQFRPNPRLYSRMGAYVLGAYGGAYSFDRKSNSLVLGGRLGYYVLDRIQAEAGVAWTHIRRPEEIVESLFDLSLEAEDFHMLFYHLNLTWEILPGRQMVPFLSAGVGSSIMLGKTEPSFNFGAGTMLFVSKRTAMRWEVRDYRLESGSDDARVKNNNIEFTLGTSLLY